MTKTEMRSVVAHLLPKLKKEAIKKLKPTGDRPEFVIPAKIQTKYRKKLEAVTNIYVDDVTFHNRGPNKSKFVLLFVFHNQIEGKDHWRTSHIEIKPTDADQTLMNDMYKKHVEDRKAFDKREMETNRKVTRINNLKPASLVDAIIFSRVTNSEDAKSLEETVKECFESLIED